jgi:hypothetical protein
MGKILDALIGSNKPNVPPPVNQVNDPKFFKKEPPVAQKKK